MESLNWKRIIAGGLLNGLLLNVGEFAVEPLMGPYMQDFFNRLGLPVPGESAMLALAATAFLVGILTIWLYAAIRPLYGPGARTAVIAGVVSWAFSCALPNVAMYAFGLYGAELFWFATLFPLVETVLATLAGAWVYRGHGAPARATSQA
jgi:hypothetical protein